MRVRAAGVDPVDWKFREGAIGTDRHFPLVLGWDVAGVVVEAAGTADGPAAGDEVYGMLPLPHGGAYQEFAVLPASAVVPRPAGLCFPQAAAVPLAALTAWQSVDAVHMASGQRVPVHAGTGGVGHFAVQLAKARLGTCRGHRLTTQSRPSEPARCRRARGPHLGRPAHH
ncbi:alcohol dehydrogenase catalytic domain-containing protein [Streptomyces sp. NPDC018833]|uniref:alcohol dehydrogenase catalytic domain-containing protein n=1 Tax=Streptomyces sp. NPDC018833 TaxID=3365053 RepID=UPI003791C5CF